MCSFQFLRIFGLVNTHSHYPRSFTCFLRWGCFFAAIAGVITITASIAAAISTAATAAGAASVPTALTAAMTASTAAAASSIRGGSGRAALGGGWAWRCLILGLCNFMNVVGRLFISLCRYCRRRRRGGGFGFVDFRKLLGCGVSSATAATPAADVGDQVYFDGLPAGLGRRKEDQQACHRPKDDAMADEG